MIAKLMALLYTIVAAAAAIPANMLQAAAPEAEAQSAFYSTYDFMRLEILAPTEGFTIAEGDTATLSMEYEGLYAYGGLHFGLYLSDELENINKSTSRIIKEYEIDATPQGDDGKKALLKASCSFSDLSPGKYAIWAYAAKGSDSIDEMVYANTIVEVLARRETEQEGWFDEGGKRYFGEGGYLKTGWQSIEGEWYFFDALGAMTTGWNREEADWFYLGQDGKMLTGWQLIDGGKYFFDENGAMARGWLMQNQQRFYFSQQGEMATGWHEIGDDYSTSMYYFESTGHMATYWKNIEGEDYYFQSNGKMITGLKNIDGKTYVFSETGKLLE